MTMLAGDLIALFVERTSNGPLPPRERGGGADPQSVVEFLAFDIPFRTEPAVGVVFPPEVRRG